MKRMKLFIVESIEKATDDEKEAFSNADLVFVTMPATTDAAECTENRAFC